MITRLLSMLRVGIEYLKSYPQFILVLLLLIIIPLLFLYSGQQFLQAGKANQESLQKERVGLLQDVFVSLLRASNYDAQKIQTEIQTLTSLNPDIITFSVVKLFDGELQTIASSIEETIEEPLLYSDLYRAAAVRTDESLIFEAYTTQGRQWSVYRAVESQPGTFYFVYTAFSLAHIDTLFAQREQQAYFSLLLIYLFLFGVAYWHVKMTDYRSLYLKTKKTVADKDMFTNMVTHELRAPLTAIRGYASMLMETDPEKVELKRIRQSAERSLGIVNDLLDVARLQSGKLKISMAPCNLSEVVAFVLSELEVTAHDKQITLSKSISSSIQVLADEKRLQQVFINLVTNAIKYTQAGSIVIEAKGVNDDVEVRIKDTGSGIDSADQKRLFAPFFRVKSKSVNATTGTGLGMLITKQLIEHMNGTIAVESIKGVGTNIVITLSTAPETQTK